MGNAASSSPPSASAPAQHDTVSTDPEPPSSLQPPPPPSQCGDCREEFQAPGKLPFTCPHCFACTRCKTCLETIARCPNCRKLWPDRSQPNSSLSRLLGLHGNEDDNDKEDEEEIAKVGMKMQRVSQTKSIETKVAHCMEYAIGNSNRVSNMLPFMSL